MITTWCTEPMYTVDEAAPGGVNGARTGRSDGRGNVPAVTVHPYPLDAADRALRDLKAGAFDGAAVLIP